MDITIEDLGCLPLEELHEPIIYDDNAFNKLALLAVSQARQDAENGDPDALDWLSETGAAWMSILGAGDQDISDMLKDVYREASYRTAGIKKPRGGGRHKAPREV